jgi:hypothetical protein
MLGLRSPLLVVASLTMLGLSLFVATTVRAQTPNTAADKQVVEASTATIANPAKIPAATIKTSDATDAKPSETTPAVKTEAAAATSPPTTTAAAQATPTPPPCPAGTRLVKADVVAIPKAVMLNRLGATIPNAFIFALKRDTVGTGTNIQLRPGKRPRPIVLRANVKDCLQITFTNAIPPSAFQASTPQNPPVGTQEVSLHIQGQEWAVSSNDDGSFVGRNDSSLASTTPAPTPMPPQTQIYTLFVRNEGTYLLYSMGDNEAAPLGQVSRGLFGALNVQPEKAEWYRSQVTQKELALATKKDGSGNPIKTANGQPVINYNAVYPPGSTWDDGTPIPADTPILKMLDSKDNLVYTDLTAIITGPDAGRFAGTTGPNNPEPPCNAANNGSGAGDPLFCANPAAPDRKQPYREVTIIYHEVGQVATQAFPVFTDPQMASTVNAGFDGFAINFGTGGIGAEVYANRIGVGPMGGCVDCKFEEFFLSAWSVGDPAMLVDRPANSSVLPPFASLPASPPVPSTPPSPPAPAPVLCTSAQLGDTGTPNPNCANARVSANASGFPYTLAPLPKATKAYYPDDPSNVYHSYINDHLKFRIHHGGTVATHVHHQHAHQWLQSPNSDDSSYLDSQMISPGASYTLEMTYNGSGNRNKVVGDSIFHCHFYPHFAAGMWAMWRTHDTFEEGSTLDANGLPVAGTRALPDGEIKVGSPMPALVPMPTLPMAPMPSAVFIQNGQIVYGTPGTPDPTGANVTVNPGFPFFIPGVAGMRAPHPPFDFAPDGSGGFLDGGLPRHVVTGGSIAYEKHDQFDWSKDFATIKATQLPETGTNVEKVAIKFFSTRCYPSFLPDGTAGACPSTPVVSPNMTQNTPPTGFIVNGLPLGPQLGAPFADPGVDDSGNPINVDPVTKQQRIRRYKAAAIQLNVRLNKAGWHFPQQRMLTLWNDVKPTLQYTPGGSGRAPEPLFFRGNSGDIVEYWHTNLVPNYYLVDDFQVRTPTDIIGQHIHLVKFDVTSSDGAGNGFNYEDGTFSPDEVREILHAINSGGSWASCPGCPTTNLQPKAPPAEICAGPNPPAQCATAWMGAQTTVQRWYLDPLVNSQNVDRTLRTVFTHDHFGPSTHQQVGLYAGLVVEPTDSLWRSAEDGSAMGGGTISTPPVRPDGGPTSWRANIIMPTAQDSYREFVLEFQDLQLAYDAASKTAPNPAKNMGWRDPNHAINATVFPEFNQVRPRLVSTGNITPITGTQSVNYYNEPLPFRVGASGDLSYAYDNAAAKVANPNFAPDPITPLMRAYQNDNVQIRTLVGAHVFAHQFNLMGPTWFAEPSWQNSGYRSNQPMGLSEHFELLFKVPASTAPLVASGPVRKCPDGMSNANCVDYLYSPSLDENGLAQGLWGIFRSYDPTVAATRLQPLPNNPIGPTAATSFSTCPTGLQPSQKRVYNVTAVTSQAALAAQAQAPGQLVFNNRGPASGFISTLNGIMYVRSEDLNANGTLKSDVPIEPLILRANAGDCIEVNLTNKISPSSRIFQKTFNWPAPYNGKFNSKASNFVGLHPQLLSYDAYSSYGMNVGWNRQGGTDQVVAFGKTIKYQWYAGKIDREADGSLNHTAVEFGALNLFASDPMFQHPNGLFGQMIIEPADSTWDCGEDANPKSCDGSGTASPTSRASATIKVGGDSFREFSVMISDALITSSTSSAINYRTEPKSQRYLTSAKDFSCMTSNILVQPGSSPSVQIGEPKTPIFTAAIGSPVRFRMTHPMGTGDSQVFTIHGHQWQRNPYQNNSTIIGNNNLSQWLGSRDNHGSSDHFDLVIDKAGGQFGKAGDYLYTAYLPDQALLGAWGLFRVDTLDNLKNPTRTPGPNAVCSNQQKAPAAAKPARAPILNLDQRFRRAPLNPSARQ